MGMFITLSQCKPTEFIIFLEYICFGVYDINQFV
jgi:hypothetical protein